MAYDTLNALLSKNVELIDVSSLRGLIIYLAQTCCSAVAGRVFFCFFCSADAGCVLVLTIG